jgi:hypothetical protein
MRRVMSGSFSQARTREWPMLPAHEDRRPCQGGSTRLAVVMMIRRYGVIVPDYSAHDDAGHLQFVNDGFVEGGGEEDARVDALEL